MEANVLERHQDLKGGIVADGAPLRDEVAALAVGRRDCIVSAVWTV